METSFCSAEITELAKAMLKVQADVQPALKDRENPFTKSNYATLNSVMDACRQALLVHDIWLSQYPVPVESGHLGLVTKLTHAESGQWQSSLLIMPLPKADPQGYGSALTYGRRYGLAALIGIVTEEDDDGNAASWNRNSGQPRAKAEKPHVNNSGDQTRQPGTIDPQQALAAMPKLDGIRYEAVNTQDGKLCILAEGDTRAKKSMLSQAGFHWSSGRKLWWRYADAV